MSDPIKINYRFSNYIYSYFKNATEDKFLCNRLKNVIRQCRKSGDVQLCGIDGTKIVRFKTVQDAFLEYNEGNYFVCLVYSGGVLPFSYNSNVTNFVSYIGNECECPDLKIPDTDPTHLSHWIFSPKLLRTVYARLCAVGTIIYNTFEKLNVLCCANDPSYYSADGLPNPTVDWFEKFFDKLRQVFYLHPKVHLRETWGIGLDQESYYISPGEKIIGSDDPKYWGNKNGWYIFIRKLFESPNERRGVRGYFVRLFYQPECVFFVENINDIAKFVPRQVRKALTFKGVIRSE